MRLKDLLLYFQGLIPDAFEGCYLGQLIDGNQEKVLGLYLETPVGRLDTISNSKKPYTFMDISLLIRYTGNYGETEDIARRLYEKIAEIKNENVEIAEMKCLIELIDEYPLPSIKREGLWEQIIRARVYIKL